MNSQRFAQNLHSYNVLIEDKSQNSPKYFVLDEVPTELTAGKNLIKILGSNFLAAETPLKIEALDATGNPLFIDVTEYLDEIGYRIISIWVDDQITKGISQLIIMGEATEGENGEDIPQQWQRKYNIRWSKQIPTDPTKQNSTEILFTELPRIFVTGIKTVSKEISPISVTFRQEYLTQSAGFVSYDVINSISPAVNSPIKSLKFQQAAIWSQIAQRQTNEVGTTVTSKGTQRKEFTSAIQNGYQHSRATTQYRLIISGASFVPNMIGGTINVYQPQNVIPPTSSADYVPGTDGSFKATIADIINNNVAYVEDGYVIQQRTNQTIDSTFVTRFDSSVYCISYSFSNSDVQYLTSSVVPNINIDVQIGNFRPISGDVFRIKAYAKRRNLDPNYVLIYDGNLTPEELLVDPFYPNQTTYRDVFNNKRMLGNFVVQSDIVKYWHTESIGNDGKHRPFAVNHVSCSEAIHIFPWTRTITSSDFSQFDPHTILKFSSSISFLEKSNMALKFRAFASYDSESRSYPEIEIYMSGSSFNQKYRLDQYGHQYGKYIGKIHISESARLFDDVVFPFQVDKDGLGHIVFKIKGGQWFLTNISLKPYEEYGFTPDNFRFQINVPYDISSSVDFKFEYYDFTGKQAQYTSFINNFLLKTQYYTKEYLGENNVAQQTDRLFAPDTRLSPNTDILHQYNLNRNVTTIDGVIEAIRKSDIYNRDAYIALINTRSSSRYLADDDFQIPPID